MAASIHDKNVCSVCKLTLSAVTLKNLFVDTVIKAITFGKYDGLFVIIRTMRLGLFVS